MSLDGRKVVWVLGAGFSAGLGGPLLPNLLSRTLEKDIAVRYPLAGSRSFPELHTHAANSVRGLYEYGLSDSRLRSPDSRVHKENLWAHAEEFLDYLDTAAGESASAQAESTQARATRLIEIASNALSIHASLSDLGAAARRLIAAECSAFLHGSALGEKWNPYFRWARSIGPTDTIISLNYDLVVETLIRDAKMRAAVVLPGPDTGDQPDACSVLKLHGSVDWRRHKGGAVERTDPLFALEGPKDELVMATPGPSKISEATGVLRRLWDMAEWALNAADAVVFVGYRFPETDAQARELLLGAIRANSQNSRPDLEGHHLSFHVVLGATGHDSDRLKAMLQFVCSNREHLNPPGLIGRRTYWVHALPLRSQDFLGIVNRNNLI